MNRLFLCAIILLTFVVACATGVPPESLTGLPLLRLAEIDEPGLFSANQDATKIAISNNGLSLFEPESNSVKKLSSRPPVALAWSPDGLTLAAAFKRADYVTELLLYTAEGSLLNEAVLPVALSHLSWSRRGDLLAAGFVLKVYSFGGNLRQLLYRIADGGVVENLLTDSTLRPSLVRQVEPLLHSLLPVSFSPQGDELVFLRLHDPPEFSPYFQLLYQNWQADKPRELQKLPVQKISFNWDLDGNCIELLFETERQTLDLWPSAENAVVLSTAEDDRVVDGRVYRGPDLVADWGEGAQIQMLSDGRFLLAVNRSLYLGDGLKASRGQLYHGAEWNLRRWRYDELVTPAEYQKLLEEMD